MKYLKETFCSTLNIRNQRLRPSGGVYCPQIFILEKQNYPKRGDEGMVLIRFSCCLLKKDKMFRVVFPSLSQNISKPYLDNYFSDTENKVSDVIVYKQTDRQTLFIHF